ncbi:hypothetical protein PRIPAC_97029 [Pristionchus pacificus]|uniref:Uncharacterized protein n=1 Tax=Pristionchus pacificus TaxID=54126 RepID=A0A454Y5V4_PRIPA|nr:hypothetical protein PRIPAC_97029 [Pristionchus pacificus]|eukprot:PDM63718.1 hypothetical protein PRIPAC_49691 [Pristionchus pacificus]
MTDKEIEEELLKDPEASLAEIYKKRDVRTQIYAALGEAPPKGRPPRNEMDILKERVRRKFGAVKKVQF